MKDETWHKTKLQPSSLVYSYKYSFILTSEIGFKKNSDINLQHDSNDKSYKVPAFTTAVPSGRSSRVATIVSAPIALLPRIACPMRNPSCLPQESGEPSGQFWSDVGSGRYKLPSNHVKPKALCNNAVASSSLKCSKRRKS